MLKPSFNPCYQRKHMLHFLLCCPKWETQVGEREGSQLAIKHVGNPKALLIEGPENHNLALMEVDSEARHALQTEEDEFEIGNRQSLGLYHDDGVVRILKMRYPSQNQWIIVIAMDQDNLIWGTLIP